MVIWIPVQQGAEAQALNFKPESNLAAFTGT